MGTVTISQGVSANRDSPQSAGMGDGSILPELGTVASSPGSRANGDCPHFRRVNAAVADRSAMGTVTISQGVSANRDSPQCAGMGDGSILPELGTVAIGPGSRANGDCPHFRRVNATVADRSAMGTVT